MYNKNYNSETPDTNVANRKKWIACLILLLVNLLNYMDRYTIVGVMDRLKPYFDMNDKESGMLQVDKIWSIKIK